MITLLLALALQDDPRDKDKTGVAWVHPFTKAQARARETGRLLFIKPIAFGTSDDGAW